MDNNTNNFTYEDVLKKLKYRVETLKRKCSIAQEQLEKNIVEISLLDKDIGQMEREQLEHKSKIKKIQDLWRDQEIEIEKIKWMQEKAFIILECNRRKNILQLKTMDIIRQNHSNLITYAFKTVRQETARMMINNEINNLVDRKKELGNKLRRLQKTKTENENYLAEAWKELIEIKTRGEAVFRLQNKLQESETSRLNAVVKLNNLQTLGFMKIDDFQLSHLRQKVEY